MKINLPCMRGTVRTGFTIVELTVVIVVIGILASITAALYPGIQHRAHQTRMQVVLRQYQTAITLMHNPANSLDATCLGQASDYPSTDIFEAGQCLKAEPDAPSQLLTAENDTKIGNTSYAAITAEVTPPSIDASSVATTPGLARFRGAAVIRGFYSSDPGEAFTYIFYKKPAAGCILNDRLATTLQNTASNTWIWAFTDVCIQEIEDTRIQCRDLPNVPPFLEARAALGCL